MPRTYGMPARPSSASEQAERAGKATGLTLPTSLVSRRLPVDGFGREEQAKWTSDDTHSHREIEQPDEQQNKIDLQSTWLNPRFAGDEDLHIQQRHRLRETAIAAAPMIRLSGEQRAG
ncbi:hypothetical protein PaG_04381 [Moesziomyces aphidis]|uniref:Uncharacterized protein n=1 Tax=Moesziomyces aphidis TaxID=84754 RepID=W3VKT1_MOEAP|nr:hypothetical protein PaG_04381 [Moesziomyces aphidis]